MSERDVKLIRAPYDGTCRRCGARIHAGDQILHEGPHAAACGLCALEVQGQQPLFPREQAVDQKERET